jgi:hypothetical protein
VEVIVGLVGDLARLDWEHTAIKLKRGFEKLQEHARKMEELKKQRRMESPPWDGPAYTRDQFWDKPAYIAAQYLPRNVAVLKDMAMDTRLPIDQRAKALEVMIYRGAVNDVSYDAMGSLKAYVDERWRMGVDGLTAVDQFGDRRDEFAERRSYQEAARDAIMRSPEGHALFNELSKSPDQLPQGRSGATEFMNMMLRNGGVYGNDESRQHFEKEMLALPAETRGRMMYHLLDAGQSSEVHLKGGQRATGAGVDFSIDTGRGGLGVGFSRSWDYLPDNHWKEVGKDTTRQMNHDLQGREQGFLDAHEKGLKEAAALDKGVAPN